MGLLAGDDVGLLVGDAVVGDSVWVASVGDAVGDLVGDRVGDVVGDSVGELVVGLVTGDLVGSLVADVGFPAADGCVAFVGSAVVVADG